MIININDTRNLWVTALTYQKDQQAQDLMDLLPLTPRRLADDLEARAIGKLNYFLLIRLPS